MFCLHLVGGIAVYVVLLTVDCEIEIVNALLASLVYAHDTFLSLLRYDACERKKGTRRLAPYPVGKRLFCCVAVIFIQVTYSISSLAL